MQSAGVFRLAALTDTCRGMVETATAPVFEDFHGPQDTGDAFPGAAVPGAHVPHYTQDQIDMMQARNNLAVTGLNALKDIQHTYSGFQKGMADTLAMQHASQETVHNDAGAGVVGMFESALGMRPSGPPAAAPAAAPQPQGMGPSTAAAEQNAFLMQGALQRSQMEASAREQELRNLVQRLEAKVQQQTGQLRAAQEAITSARMEEARRLSDMENAERVATTARAEQLASIRKSAELEMAALREQMGAYQAQLEQDNKVKTAQLQSVRGELEESKQRYDATIEQYRRQLAAVEQDTIHMINRGVTDQMAAAQRELHSLRQQLDAKEGLVSDLQKQVVGFQERSAAAARETNAVAARLAEVETEYAALRDTHIKSLEEHEDRAKAMEAQMTEQVQTMQAQMDAVKSQAEAARAEAVSAVARAEEEAERVADLQRQHEEEAKSTTVGHMQRLQDLEAELAEAKGRRVDAEVRARELQDAVDEKVQAEQALEEKLRLAAAEMGHLREDAKSAEARIRERFEEDKQRLLAETHGLRANHEQMQGLVKALRARAAELQSQKDIAVRGAKAMREKFDELEETKHAMHARHTAAMKEQHSKMQAHINNMRSQFEEVLHKERAAAKERQESILSQFEAALKERDARIEALKSADEDATRPLAAMNQSLHKRLLEESTQREAAETAARDAIKAVAERDTAAAVARDQLEVAEAAHARELESLQQQMAEVDAQWQARVHDAALGVLRSFEPAAKEYERIAEEMTEEERLLTTSWRSAWEAAQKRARLAAQDAASFKEHRAAYHESLRASLEAAKRAAEEKEEEGGELDAQGYGDWAESTAFAEALHESVENILLGPSLAEQHAALSQQLSQAQGEAVLDAWLDMDLDAAAYVPTEVAPTAEVAHLKAALEDVQKLMDAQGYEATPNRNPSPQKKSKESKEPVNPGTPMGKKNAVARQLVHPPAIDGVGGPPAPTAGESEYMPFQERSAGESEYMPFRERSAGESEYMPLEVVNGGTAAMVERAETLLAEAEHKGEAEHVRATAAEERLERLRANSEKRRAAAEVLHAQAEKESAAVESRIAQLKAARATEAAQREKLKSLEAAVAAVAAAGGDSAQAREVEEMRAFVRRTMAENEALHRTLQGETARLAHTRSSEEALRAEMSEMQREIETLREHREQHHKRAVQLAHITTTLQGRLEAFKAESNHRAQQIKRLQAQIDERDRKLDRATEAATSMEKELQDTLRQLQHEKSEAGELLKQHGDATSTATRLKEEAETLRETLAAVRASASKATGELRVELRAVQASNEQLRDAARTAAADLEAKQKEAEDARNAMREQKDIIRDLNTKLGDATGEVLRLRAAVEAEQGNAARAQEGEKDERARSAAAIAAAEDRVKELEQDAATQQSRFEALAAQARRYEQDIVTLQARVDSLTEQVRAGEEKLSEQVQELRAAKERVTHLQAQLRQKDDELERAYSAERSAKAKADAAMTAASKAEEDVETHRKQRDAAQASMARMEGAMRDMKSEMRAMDEELVTARKHAEAVESTIRDVAAGVREEEAGMRAAVEARLNEAEEQIVAAQEYTDKVRASLQREHDAQRASLRAQYEMQLTSLREEAASVRAAEMEAMARQVEALRAEKKEILEGHEEVVSGLKAQLSKEEAARHALEMAANGLEVSAGAALEETRHQIRSSLQLELDSRTEAMEARHRAEMKRIVDASNDALAAKDEAMARLKDDFASREAQLQERYTQRMEALKEETARSIDRMAEVHQQQRKELEKQVKDVQAVAEKAHAISVAQQGRNVEQDVAFSDTVKRMDSEYTRKLEVESRNKEALARELQAARKEYERKVERLAAEQSRLQTALRETQRRAHLAEQTTQEKEKQMQMLQQRMSATTAKLARKINENRAFAALTGRGGGGEDLQAYLPGVMQGVSTDTSTLALTGELQALGMEQAMWNARLVQTAMDVQHMFG